jgi:Oxidoreductase family, NAD-binding Rossmann fold
MQAILAGEGRNATLLQQSRRASTEQDLAYYERLRSAFEASGSEIAWLCVPPGTHIPVLMKAAIDSDLHVVVEKPWLCSEEITQGLEARAKAQHKVIGIHYEYCLMEVAETWRREWNSGNGMAFGGRMHVNRPDHIGLSALDNLGSHLFSIHEYCVPNAEITEMDCAYAQPDDRRVWLESGGRQLAEINLLTNKEPIIQRFIARVESAARGAAFPFDLQFALRIAERTAQWRRQTSQ